MKKILILLTILLLTGCSVNYDLTVTNKGQVKEKMYIYIANEKILSESSSINEYLDYHATLYKQNDFYRGYNIKTKKSTPDSYFIVENSYKTLEEYTKSLSFKSMFDGAVIDKIGDYTTFVSSKNSYLEKLKNDDLLSEENRYDSFTINIKFYNEVIESNADKVDEKNNIYTWNVSQDNSNDSIYFKIGSKVKYFVMLKDYIENNLISIIIIGGALIAIISIFSIILLKSKKNNEV